MEIDAIIEGLAATPKTVAHLVAELSDAEMGSAEAGEWSARVILAHLRDDESLVMRLRLERMLAEDHPMLVPFDEQAWADGRTTSRDRKEELLGDFALQRQASAARLRFLRPDEWERQGTQPEYGTWTVRGFAEHWLEHDRTHIGQLERVLGTTVGEVMERRFSQRD